MNELAVPCPLPSHRLLIQAGKVHTEGFRSRGKDSGKYTKNQRLSIWRTIVNSWLSTPVLEAKSGSKAQIKLPYSPKYRAQLPLTKSFPSILTAAYTLNGSFRQQSQTKVYQEQWPGGGFSAEERRRRVWEGKALGSALLGARVPAAH